MEVVPSGVSRPHAEEEVVVVISCSRPNAETFSGKREFWWSWRQNAHEIFVEAVNPFRFVGAAVSAYMNHIRWHSGAGMWMDLKSGLASARRSAIIDRRCAQRVGNGSFVDCGDPTWDRANDSF